MNRTQRSGKSSKNAATLGGIFKNNLSFYNNGGGASQDLKTGLLSGDYSENPASHEILEMRDRLQFQGIDTQAVLTTPQMIKPQHFIREAEIVQEKQVYHSRVFYIR